ncbi:MAG: ATP-dependent Clp protease ATP-binding subunit [Chloroflexia bacterium]|nr:ATP-dependent Clp protease ATP-binding subunit [Chloroflexia bacterium]
MSVWMRNLKTRLQDRPVVILYGNVRDRYIDEQGRVYDNLTALLSEVAQSFSAEAELVFYDPLGEERCVGGEEPASPPTPPAAGELAATAPSQRRPDPAAGPQRIPPSRVLAQWSRQLGRSEGNRFLVLFYLDKLVSYRAHYAQEEQEILLWLEKAVENIQPNHRLLLVALQDTMVPIELYTHSPQVAVLPIPAPDKADRLAYLKHRLGPDVPHLELIANLTDGLYLRSLEHMVDDIQQAVDGGAEAGPGAGEKAPLGTREIRRLVNRYRIGEQKDHWGELSIQRLGEAAHWFVQVEGIKGQEEAIQKVVDMLVLARAGLSGVASGTASKPKGVLFFAGPTGVGKTFMAKKLAKFLFGTEEAFLRYDMSEFKEEHTVSKLIGSPPGYVGYERGGTLTNAVREKPFAVILFDEVEKAHPKIMDIFLQILDEGRLTDSRGQTIFFTETVIIFTSNLGTRTSDSRGHPVAERQAMDVLLEDDGLSPQERKRRVQEHFVRAVERFFMFEISRPELLNRIGNNIVPFNYIHSPEVQQEIVRSHLKRIREDFEDRYRSAGHRLQFAEDVPAWLVERYSGRIQVFGGRGIANALEDELMIPLSRAVLRAEHRGQSGCCFVAQLAPDRSSIRVEEL